MAFKSMRYSQQDISCLARFYIRDFPASTLKSSNICFSFSQAQKFIWQFPKLLCRCCRINTANLSKSHRVAFEFSRNNITHRISFWGYESVPQIWTAQERHNESHRPISASYPEKDSWCVRGESAVKCRC